MRRGEVEKGSRTALVTGANSGIGRCYAEQLAALGYNIVAVGIREEAVEQTARELSERHGIAAHPIVTDLARPEAAEELYAEVKSRGIEVDVLVNNAGMFSFLDIRKAPVERIRRMILLHDFTTTLLCKFFAEEMARRGSGYILNMASYSLWMPWPGLALYSASKNYLHAFSRAFAKEVREDGIRVTAVCPAGVATDLYGLPDNLQRLGVRLGVLLTPDSCARRGLKALWRGRRSSVPGWWNRLFIPFCVLMPSFVLRVARKLTMKLQK